MVDDLIRPGENIPDYIKIIKTDKKFPGDCRVETVCKHCGVGTPLTAYEVLCNAMLFGRNDSNNPQYRFGSRFIWKYFGICSKKNELLLEPEIRRQILQELNNEKM